MPTSEPSRKSDEPAANRKDAGRDTPAPADHASGTRQQFDSFELAAVLSHYNTGEIESIQPFPRGSSASPKAIIKCARGVFLLKRRARGRADLNRVAFAHAVQLHLVRRSFPAPRIVATRRDRASFLELRGHVYELFEYLHGKSFDHSPQSARIAGYELALLHKLLAELDTENAPAWRDYHNAEPINDRFAEITARLADQPEAMRAASALTEAYWDAAARAQQQGAHDWPRHIVHGDWHPGNMVFRQTEVVGVLDFDAAHLAPRAIDIANGALQFSVTRAGEDPNRWPDDLDMERYLAFCQGYDQTPGCLISQAELRALPWLMIEALIAEAAVPIAATGRFAQLDGGHFLSMVDRKVRWIQENAPALIDALPH